MNAFKLAEVSVLKQLPRFWLQVGSPPHESWSLSMTGDYL